MGNPSQRLATKPTIDLSDILRMRWWNLVEALRAIARLKTVPGTNTKIKLGSWVLPEIIGNSAQPATTAARTNTT
jgi:hypothetical protein